MSFAIVNAIKLSYRIKNYKEAGHFMTLSRASEVNKIILEFLED